MEYEETFEDKRARAQLLRDLRLNELEHAYNNLRAWQERADEAERNMLEAQRELDKLFDNY